ASGLERGSRAGWSGGANRVAIDRGERSVDIVLVIERVRREAQALTRRRHHVVLKQSAYRGHRVYRGGYDADAAAQRSVRREAALGEAPPQPRLPRESRS